MRLNKTLFRHSLQQVICALMIVSLSCFAHEAKAAEPIGQIKQCVSELWDCGTGALKTYAKGIEAAGNVLWFLVSNPDCVAGMISGNPVTVGATGLVVGLGAAGVVNKDQCEGDIYGAAMLPIAAALDEIIPTSLLSNDLKSGFQNVLKTKGADVLKGFVQPLPVPAVPPSLGGVITCGCNALQSGAEALEDIKTVARLAKETAQSCKSAANSCPGLKQVLQVAGYVGQAITDPSSIVQDCDSMSRQQYVAARLRPLIPDIVNQFSENRPWANSYGQGLLNGALDECRSYYDRHCYKEKKAADFCAGPVNDQNFDPELWAEIGKMLNAKVFADYFSANALDLLAPPACPAEGGISFGSNISKAETDALAMRSQNAKQCTQELQTLIFGESGSYKSAVRDMLPQSREAWSAAGVRGPVDKPPIDQAKLYFRRIMTSAAVVSRIKIKERMSYYAQRDGDIKVSSAALAMPSTILNKSYGLWAKNLFIFNATKCPKDAKGWSGFGGPDKLDYLCLKDLANSLGLETQEKLVSQEFGVTIPENSIVEGSFKGALPYAKASQKYFQSVKVLPPKDESDAYEYWKTAKPLADAEYVNIAANLFPRHAARVATNNGQRKKQKEDFDQFIVVAESENKRQVALCEKTTKVEPCKKDRATVLESGKYDLNGIINVAYVGLKTTTEPVSDKVYEETIKKLSDRLKKMEQHYLSTGLLFPVDQSKVNLAGGGLKGPAAKAPNMLSLGDKGEPTPLPKAGDPIAPKGAIAIPPTTTNPTFGMRAAPSMTSGNKAAAVAIATPPSTLGAKVDKNLGPNAGLNAGAAIAATTPQQPNRENVAMIAPMTPIAPMTQMMPMTPIGPIGAGSPLAPRTNTPNVPNAVAAAVAPFNEKLYRDNRGKEFLTQWLNRCKDNDCRRDVSALLTKQLDEEVAQIKADVNAWNNKVLQERIQDIVEKRYEVQLKTELVPSTSAATSSPTTPAGPVKALTPIQPPTQPSIPPRITRIPATVR